MCAKLHTMAASNNRVDVPRSLYYCLFAPHVYIVVLHAHPVHGESHIQHNATREVVTAAHICDFMAMKTSAQQQFIWKLIKSTIPCSKK